MKKKGKALALWASGGALSGEGKAKHSVIKEEKEAGL